MKKFLLLFAFLASCTLVRAQKFSIKPVEFPDAPVGFLGMAQDSFGYIWLADNGNGLYKYDGKKTIVYKPEPNNPSSISSGRIENVFIDKEGTLWLPHFGNGLDRFDSETETFKHYKHDDLDTNTIYSDAVRDVIEDLDGNLWVGTNLGLDKFDKDKGIFIHHFSHDPDARVLREEHVRKLYLDKSGIIWVGTGSVFNGEETTGGLFSLNPKTGDIQLYRNSEEGNSLVDNRVRAIFEDSRGVFWVGTAGDGLHTMNRETGTFQRHAYDPKNPEKLSRPPLQNIFNFGVDHITFIEEDAEGFIWIGTYGNGLNRYDPVTKVTNHFSPYEQGEFHIENLAYWDILKTQDGLLWLASFYSGGSTAYMLSKLDISPPKFDFVEREGIITIAQGPDDKLFFGTNKGVETFTDGRLNQVFRTTLVNQAEGDIDVQEIKFDKDENIWAGTSGAGLFFFDRNSKKLKNYRHEPGDKNSLSNDFVGTISIQENDEIFIATMDGLDILNLNSESFEHFELRNINFSNSRMRTSKLVAVDGDGRIWVGGSGGIFRFDRDSHSFIKYYLGIGNEIVNDLYVDEDGILWIATINHGLRRYNAADDIFQPILDETGFLHKYSFIADLTQDHNGIFWISTDNHLIKYNLTSNQGTPFADDWIPKSGRRYNFGKIMTLSSGEIIFDTPSGYFRFHPNDFERSEFDAKKPFIEKFIIDETTLSADVDKELYESFRGSSSINLSHDQNNLTFQIGYIDFLNNQSEQPLTYKLENYAKDWHYTTSGNQINYYQLSPGDYILSIKAQDIFGNWGTKNLSIYIAKPWYQSWWAYAIYILIFISGVISIDRYQRKRLLKKAREEAREKELEQAIKIKEAYDQLEVAHMELKSTQSKLIQSEKMASLGELTAGIAHEIQNPLNFVNNFSEVNKELFDELESEIEKGNKNEIASIFKDLRANEEKVIQHGKRADAIVKSMLQHSRISSGEKELIEINALCDEYLRLAYHGMRAHDKSFNPELKTELDPDLPKIEVVPQDIGRVILNVLNNAFQAVREVEKPEVSVSTHLLKGQIEIVVADNGPGIPNGIEDKIFQPFFTTKPTGQGTGLGLSLSYDIIKGHGGGIRFESDPSFGTKFFITLPTKSNTSDN